MVNIKLISFSFLKFLSAAILLEYHLKGTVSWDFMHNVYMYVFSNYVRGQFIMLYTSFYLVNGYADLTYPCGITFLQIQYHHERKLKAVS